MKKKNIWWPVLQRIWFLLGYQYQRQGVCCGDDIGGWLWQQVEVTQPGGNLWGEEMTQAKTHCQCDLAHPLSCQLHPLVYDTLNMDCTTVYFTTQPAQCFQLVEDDMSEDVCSLPAPVTGKSKTKAKECSLVCQCQNQYFRKCVLCCE